MFQKRGHGSFWNIDISAHRQPSFNHQIKWLKTTFLFTEVGGKLCLLPALGWARVSSTCTSTKVCRLEVAAWHQRGNHVPAEQ